MLKIGVIADTHGPLRPEATAVLQRCDQIIHAGDVGPPDTLEILRRIAPTVAVRGNVDRAAWAAELPLSATVTWEGVTIHIVHDLHTLNIDPAREGVNIVVSGHSHRPGVEEKSGVTYLNPGSAGPRRFRLPMSMALLRVAEHVRFKIEPILLLG